MKRPEERPPLNNLDELEHRTSADPYANLFDEYVGEDPDQYEPTTEERFAEATPDELRQLAFDIFFDGSYEHQRGIIEVAKNSSRTAGQQLVLDAAKWVAGYAMGKHRTPSPHLQMVDRLQNALVYTTGANRTYSPDKGGGLVQFILPHLAGRIRYTEKGASTFINEGPIIRVPESQQKYHRIASYKLGIEALIRSHLPVEDLSYLSPEEIAYYKQIHVTHEPLVDNLEAMQIVDIDPAINPEEMALSDVQHNGVNDVLGLLPEKPKAIIEDHYGIGSRNNEVPRSLEEIGKSRGLTRERIRQIERAGLDKLTRPGIRHVINGAMRVTELSPKE